MTTLALDPVPETLVRVGIVHHAHAEPERVAGEKPAAAGEPAGRPAGMKPLRLEKRLTAAEAKTLAAADHDLCLFGLSGLPEGTAADVAGAFEPHRHVLLAPGLVRIDAEVAAALAASKKWNGQLPGLTGFEAADSVAVAKALAKRQGPLALPNLKKISPKTLSALIEKDDIDIPLVETLELIQEPDGSPTEDFVVPEGFQARQKQNR